LRSAGNITPEAGIIDPERGAHSDSGSTMSAGRRKRGGEGASGHPSGSRQRSPQQWRFDMALEEGDETILQRRNGMLPVLPA